MQGEGARGDFARQNIIRRHDVGGMEVEMIHQALPGDCVLISYLNTESLVNGSGKITMTPHELRELVIETHRQAGEDARDILQDNQPLNYADTVRLFSTIYGVKAQQEDIVTVAADNLSREGLRNNIENGVLEYLDTYPSGLCTTGMGYHSRTIWKLEDDNYIVIDPMNQNGFERFNKRSLVDYLTRLCGHQPAENNFFFFLRNENDEE